MSPFSSPVLVFILKNIVDMICGRLSLKSNFAKQQQPIFMLGDFVAGFPVIYWFNAKLIGLAPDHVRSAGIPVKWTPPLLAWYVPMLLWTLLMFAVFTLKPIAFDKSRRALRYVWVAMALLAFAGSILGQPVALNYLIHLLRP